MKHLIIIGIGNFGKIVKEYACKCNDYGSEWTLKGYLASEFDSALSYSDTIGTIDEYSPHADDVFICSYVSGKEREIAVQKIKEKNGKFINIIHPWANICSSARMGTGNIIGAFATLSVDTIIGNHNIIQDHCNLGHDSVIGNYSHLYVGTIISGKNQIGNNVSIYTGAIVYPTLKIEDNANVGAGSVVMRKVKTDTTVLGNPAKLVE